jgi:thiosulfate/3-mercaptopyruvate sulfurtransferase
VVVNALSPQLFSGESDLGYARPGRIAGSVNLSALSLIDQDNGAYLPDDALRRAAQASVGAADSEAICYCGGGIAATMDALVLDLLGYTNVSVYDASMQEWAADEALPMATG